MSRLREPMANLSPEQRAILEQHLLRRSTVKENDTIPVRNPEQRIPLTFAQQRLWLFDQIEPGGSAYNVLTAFRLTGALNPDIFELALSALVDRHETLRTVYGVTPDGEPIQLIQPPGAFRVRHLDVSKTPEEQQAHEVGNITRHEAETGFDLANGPIARATLVKTATDEHVFVLAIHQIAADDRSENILMRELGQVYAALIDRSPSPFHELPARYADFATWQRNWHRGPLFGSQLDYWKRVLDGELPVLELPADFPRPAQQSFRGGQHAFEVPEQLRGKIDALCRSEHVTLSMFLLAAYHTWLHRLGGQDDIVVGFPVANRRSVEVTDVVGLFANTLAIRMNLSGNPAFREVLARSREAVTGAIENGDAAFETLVEALRPDRDPSRSPLFQAQLVLRDTVQEDGGLSLPGVRISPMSPAGQTARFDLELTATATPERLQIAITYCADLFLPETIARMSHNLEVLLGNLVAEPGTRIDNVSLLTADERRQIVIGWNATEMEVPSTKCIHELVEEQVERTPDRVAVVAENLQLTYRELDARSNKLARWLIHRGVGRDVLVGVCMERTADLVVAVLGVLKAGGGYVGMYPDLPEDRLAYMVEDSEAPVVLTQEKHKPRLPSNVRCLALDTEWSEIDNENATRVDVDARPEDLAYVIYTSGTTGKPKGVLIEHRTVVNYIVGVAARLGLEPGMSYAMVQPLGVDSSVTVLYPSIVSGGTLHMIAETRATDPAKLGEYFERHTIDVLKIAPSHLGALETLADDPASVLPGKVLVVGGEASRREWVEKLKAAKPGLRVFNHYGPTEATVGMLTYEVRADGHGGKGVLPMGRPVPNTSAYVVNAQMEVQPVGVAGELYIGGECLARGYLKREALTAEKFVADVFRGTGRLYRTGDLVRYLEDGAIEFIGRVDHQVKIRGFRIELGEIEALIAQHEKVADTIVITWEERAGDVRLIAYVAMKDRNDPPAAQDIRSFLRAKLPEYMVPSVVVVLDELPRTPHGKVDRRALPAPETASELKETYVAPRTPMEEVVAGMWASVLGNSDVGALDDFFALGGHSLKAAQVLARVNDTFRVRFELREFFQMPTVAALAAAIEQARSNGPAPAPQAIEPISRAGEIPLSFAQQRLWFLDQYQPGTAVYTITIALDWEGDLQVSALEYALSEIARRHEPLRTVFRNVEGRPVQIIQPAAPVTVAQSDLRALPEGERKEEVTRCVNRDARLPFDLQTGPLFRAHLYRLEDTRHVFLIAVHHIVYDGWSTSILFRELSHFYSCFVGENRAPLPPLDVQYADFAHWQRQQDGLLRAQLPYWTERLQHAEPQELPTDFPRPAVQSEAGETLYFSVPPELSRDLRAFSQREGVTLYMTLLAGLQTLLYRHSGQKDILIGTAIAGRTRVEAESLIGFFINTLVLRTDFSDKPTVRHLLHRVREAALGAYAHQDVPFEKLVDVLQPDRQLDRTPLFQVMFAFQNFPLRVLNIPGLTARPWRVNTGTSKFDITLTISDETEALQGAIEYCPALFRPDSIDRMAGHFTNLLQELVRNADGSVATLPMLSDPERTQLLLDWNRTAVEYPRHSSIPELFEQRVQETPDAIALLFNDESVSYGELNRRANRLAHYLRQRGVGRGVLVGLCMERSVEMVVSLLGILKAGGAYLAMDPSYPRERLDFMLKDASATLVLTQTGLQPQLASLQAELICVDARNANVDSGPESNPATLCGPTDLAYVSFTSGSTGVPKGVCVPHRAVIRLVSHPNFVSISREDVFLQFAPIPFDASTLEVWGPLLNGARLAICPPESPSLDDLGRVLQRHAVTVLWLTAGLFQQMAQENPGGLRTVRQLLAGGDVLPPAASQKLLREFPGCTLINGYGPTENTTFTCCYPMSSPEQAAGPIPIGRPITNTQVYILSPELQPVPVGVTGELFAGGDGLARGYLNRPELTAERFIPNPFQPGSEYLYRTGDLARYRADGVVEFLGRSDTQVKIRGFRIELGEIEAVLSSHPELSESVVLAREDLPGTKRLVAYVVPLAQGAPTDDAIREFMKARLPDYMVPAVFVHLSSLPLTANGKLDRKALPAPDSPSTEPSRNAPANPTEETLVGIWRDVLRIESLGTDDNFFALGGDSILSLQIIARARQAGLHLTVRQLFQYQTIAELAAVVQSASPAKASSSTISGTVPLSPVQRWFFEQPWKTPAHWNQAMLLDVRGPVDPRLMEQACLAIVRHHDALRLRFHARAAGIEQTYATAESAQVFSRLNVSGLEAAAREKQVQAEIRRLHESLDLASGPIVRFALFEGYPNDVESKLFVVIHHLAVDGVSWRILLDDLQLAYEQAAAGDAIRLPSKTTSFQAWSERLLAYSGSVEALKERAHWRDALRTGPALKLDLMPGPDANTVGSSETVSVALDAESTRRLLQDSSSAYRTQINDLLLVAVLEAFERWTGQKELALEMEGHGREELFSEVDVSRTIGWFTSIYPVRLALPEDGSPEERIKAVKEQLRRIPKRGIGFGILRYLNAEERPSLESTAPPISFNYLGQFGQMEAEGSMFAWRDRSSLASRGSDEFRSHVLEIGAIVRDGQLRVNWTYSRDLHRRESIQGLADAFLNSLMAVITHCTSPGAGGFTPSDFPLARLDQPSLDRLLGTHPGLDDIYRLSPLQEGLMFESMYAPESAVYFVQWSCFLRGNLDQAAFRSAWGIVAERHAVLRTSFVWDDLEYPVQCVHSKIDVPWQEVDWTGVPADEQDRRFDRLLIDDRSNGFQLSTAPLMRLTLVRLGEEEHRFLWSFHHLLIDGWSLPLILREVLDTYESVTRGMDSRPVHRRPYKAYIEWLQAQDTAEAERFWRQELQGFTAPTPLTLDRPKTASGEGPVSYEEIRFRLSEKTTAALQAMGRSNQVTLNSIIQGAWAMLLSRYSNEADVMFGATSSGRPTDLAGVESIVGLFINTIPIRLHVDETADVTSWLRQVQDRQVEARRYEHTSLLDIQRWSQVPRGLPLFESLLVFENYPLDSSLWESGGPKIRIDGVRGFERTNYPLTIMVVPGAILTLRVLYQEQRFDPTTIGRVLEHFTTLLEGMAAHPRQLVGKVPILTEQERRMLLVDWNSTTTEFPRSACVHTLFEEQVARTPDRVAVFFEDRHLTYRELNASANRMAHHLRAMGVGPDDLVGVCLERSLEMIVGLLGTLKSGGAYLPLDPAYPPDRIAYMLGDAKVKVLLTQEALRASLPHTDARVICLDLDNDPARADSEMDPPRLSSPNHLAYVIYTSGSTGRPKGVMVEHGNVVNFFTGMDERIGVPAHGKWLAVTSICFDISVLELFWTLCRGLTVIVQRQEALEAQLREQPADSNGRSREDYSIPSQLLRHGVTHMQCTPSMATMLVSDPSTVEALRPLQRLMLGGEAFPVALAGQLTSLVKGKVLNMYGPTETTIWSATHCLDEDRSLVPIGRPIANTDILILDRAQQLVPVGVAGELMIGGVGVVRGYLNRPDLTAERFIPNPYREGQALYRTGDLARFLPDGNIEFLGRLDNQVKLRGFRIELGEIEAELGKHPDIREAVVVVRNDASGDPRLVAYIVPTAGGGIGKEDLRNHLRHRLPEYMVPSVFVEMEAFPHTPNGKIDRKALPAPMQTDDHARAFAEPENDLQRAIAKAWQEVLGVAQVSLDDDFFDLGGHSLSAVRLFKKIKDYTQAELGLATLFRARTVRQIAELVQHREDATWSPVVTLQEGIPSKTPLFCLHAAGGNVLFYKFLVSHMPKDQPIYAIQARGLRSDEEPLDRVLDMAQFYISEMRKVQPQGPYNVAGYSFGGVIAYEMACELKRMGLDVGLLVLFDTDRPDYVPTLKTRIRLNASYLLSLDLKQKSRYLSRKAQGVFRRTLRLPQKPGGNDPTAELGGIREALKTARKDYEPEPYPGRITLFRAREVGVSGPRTRDLGWKELGQDIDIIMVPGDHINMLYEPNVATAAKELRDCLNAVHDNVTP